MSVSKKLERVAKLASELEAQGAEVISASASNWVNEYGQIHLYDDNTLPDEIRARGAPRAPNQKYMEYGYEQDGISVFWLVSKNNKRTEA